MRTCPRTGTQASSGATIDKTNEMISMLSQTHWAMFLRTSRAGATKSLNLSQAESLSGLRSMLSRMVCSATLAALSRSEMASRSRDLAASTAPLAEASWELA
ncbi:MAG: hypothetical protein IPL94_09575 [Tetrasphaera sp.]|nr:hypothetical protein [Tetrasphaera sp.]